MELSVALQQLLHFELQLRCFERPLRDEDLQARVLTLDRSNGIVLPIELLLEVCDLLVPAGHVGIVLADPLSEFAAALR